MNKNSCQMVYTIQPFFVLKTEKYFKRRCIGTEIAHYYYFETKALEPPATIVVPDGAMDIIFECSVETPTAFIYGTVSKGNSQPFKPGTKYFGVRFLPGTKTVLFGISMTDIIDTQISLDFLPDFRVLSEKIAAETNFRKRAELFEAFYQRLQKNGDQYEPPLLLTQSVNYILQKRGMLRIKDLEDYTLYTSRYISSVFKTHLGISPQQFARYIKLQTILQYLNMPVEITLTDIAQRYGFSDQSHFIRDFKNFTNLSPGTYIHLIAVSNYRRRIVEL